MCCSSSTMRTVGIETSGRTGTGQGYGTDSGKIAA
jgi:hypothetical protein